MSKFLISLLLLISAVLSLIACTNSQEFSAYNIDDLLNGNVNSSIVNNILYTYSHDGVEIIIDKALCTENRIIIKLTSTNYIILDALLFTDNLKNSITQNLTFENIEDTFSSPVYSKSIHSIEKGEGAYEYIIDYRGNNKIADSNHITLVITNDVSTTPIVFYLNITNYGDQKNILVCDSKNNVIGVANMSSLYAEVHLYNTIADLENFSNNLSVVTNDHYVVPFEVYVLDCGNYNINLDFKQSLDISNVDYILYEN